MLNSSLSLTSTGKHDEAAVVGSRFPRSKSRERIGHCENSPLPCERTWSLGPAVLRMDSNSSRSALSRSELNRQWEARIAGTCRAISVQQESSHSGVAEDPCWVVRVVGRRSESV